MASSATLELQPSTYFVALPRTRGDEGGKIRLPVRDLLRLSHSSPWFGDVRVLDFVEVRFWGGRTGEKRGIAQVLAICHDPRSPELGTKFLVRLHHGLDWEFDPVFQPEGTIMFTTDQEPVFASENQVVRVLCVDLTKGSTGRIVVGWRDGAGLRESDIYNRCSGGGEADATEVKLVQLQNQDQLYGVSRFATRPREVHFFEHRVIPRASTGML
jgi:hypothetical protein